MSSTIQTIANDHSSNHTDDEKLVALFHELQTILQARRQARLLQIDEGKKQTKNQSPVPPSGGAVRAHSFAPSPENKKEEGSVGLLISFMEIAGEPITWTEATELWNNLLKINHSDKLPTLDKSFHDLSKSLHDLSLHDLSKRAFLLSNLQLETTFPEKSDISALRPTDHDGGERKDLRPLALEEGIGATDNANLTPNSNHADDDERKTLDQQEPIVRGRPSGKILMDDVSPQKRTSRVRKNSAIILLNDETEEQFNLTPDDIRTVSKGIKETYGIRLRDDKSEIQFIVGSLLFLWVTVFTLVIVHQFYPDNEDIGSFTWEVLIEAIILFIVEVVWECILSRLVIKYNVKINYTRKLGNLLKVPKYFAADLFPFYKSTATSLVASLTINQTLFCIMYSRQMREKVPFFAYVFLSQDRREDRPDTLIFQVTEDIMRFGIYFPFKILVANRLNTPAIIYIPIAVNNIGDGLAEPIGVKFGKHKYSTTAMYHKRNFFKSKFTRSYEGSSCVYITTLAVVAFYYRSFNTHQFWITIAVLPFLMTLAEAKAPHTNDGPFLALVGCGFLSAVLLLM